jgi:uncharacterized protein (TIGR03118 family)
MTLVSRLRKSAAIAAFGIGALCATTWRAEAGAYVQTNLVSNIPGLASLFDTDLKNPWGVSHGPTTPFWVSDQGANLSTLYNVTASGVTKSATVVSIPTTGSGPQGPTGQVTNLGLPPNAPFNSFVVNGIPSRFIFANLNGTISAWNGQGTAAIVQATTPGHVYTGLAVNDAHTILYAANDAGAGSIDVFNSSFVNVTTPTQFVTPAAVSALNLVPFNVQVIGGNVYVTYAPSGLTAQRNAASGQGAVVVFDENGNFLQTLILGSELASPWGITLAPSAVFGPFSDDLLVGNFSFLNSEINAFDPLTGAFEGTIPVNVGAGNTAGGLWALAFGNAGNNGSPATLFFTDGINGEVDGLFAQITFVPEPSSLALLAAAFGLLAVRRARARR